MPMLADPSLKYEPYPAVPFPDGYVRQWPTRRTTIAPTWLSTDLRDGNQALVNPMSNETKLKLFRLLVQIGFKEIEVAYPVASDAEFNFVRSLIENNEIPDDVTIQVITPARPELITRTIASLAGVKNAVIHLYNATSPVFREVVFRNTPEQTIDLTLNAVRLVRTLTDEAQEKYGGHYRLNYCLETFSQTEIEFAVDLGNRVLEAWGKAGPGKDRVAFNLAATVECAPPNHYADMVEYFSNNINHRENVILSIHPHNDRGTGVAAAEMGLLAGGSRVEGCLLGNGERTGNVDIITLALNMYTQGVSPGLDFSNLPEIVKVVERCNEMSTPPRYPYAGALVYSAFAGTHQDAIKKGFDAQDKKWAEADAKGEKKKIWRMPYIPVDPADLGIGYDNLIRVSSQSGKAGAAYVVKRGLGLDLPRKMQVSFYRAVQSESEESGKEMTHLAVVDTFRKTFILDDGTSHHGRIKLKSGKLVRPSSEPPTPSSEYSDESAYNSTDEQQYPVKFEGEIVVDDNTHFIEGEGIGAFQAVQEALRSHLELDITVVDYAMQKLKEGGSTSGKPQTAIATFVEITYKHSGAEVTHATSQWGVGLDTDAATSRIRALLSAVNCVIGEREIRRPRPHLKFHRRPSHVRTTSEQDIISHLNIRAGHDIRRSVELSPVRQLNSAGQVILD